MSMSSRPAMRALVAGMAVATVLAASGCSSSSTTSKSGADPNGTLVFGISAAPTEMLPWKATSTQSLEVIGQIYSTLLNQNADLEPEAGLAKMPTITNGGKTYTFQLRSGLKFTNGSPLTSADVKYSFDSIMDPATDAVSATNFTSVQDVQAPNPRTVVIDLKEPDAAFLSGLTVTGTSILPQGVSLSSLETKPIGSGPYEFASQTPNESITLKRNPGYYQGRPGLGKLQFRIIQSDQSMVSALKSGGVDMAIFDNSATAKTAEAKTVKVSPVSELNYHVLQLRASTPLLKNKYTRLAIQCAISRKEVLDSAALGAGQITGPITSPAFKSNTADQPCPDRNVAKAKEYLKKAGQPNGFTLNTMVPSGLYSSAADEAQSVQAQLKSVGINMTIDTLDSGTYVSQWLAGKFDAAIALNGSSVDPDTTYNDYFTSTGHYNNVAGYSSPILDKLFAEGRATTDMAKRKQIYTQISNQLVDNAVWIWLYTGNEFIAQNTGVKGFQAQTDAGLSSLWKTTISS